VVANSSPEDRRSLLSCGVRRPIDSSFLRLERARREYIRRRALSVDVVDVALLAVELGLEEPEEGEEEPD
jgi:hypothetical protein